MIIYLSAICTLSHPTLTPMMYEAAAEASPTANPNVIIERRRQIHRQPATSSNFLHVNGPSALKEQRNNGLEPYIFVVMAHPIVVSCVACCVPLRLVVGDVHGETRNNYAISKVGIVSVNHPNSVLMLFCSATPLKPFEACCSCVGSINQTLEDFTKWPVKCGNAIKNCSSACPSP